MAAFWEVGTGGSEVQGFPGLQTKFSAGQYSLARPHLKIKS